MSYTVDLELDRLNCRDHESATQAAARINSDDWMRNHVTTSVSNRSPNEGDGAWHLCIDDYDGCGWKEPAAQTVWFAIAPFMADDALLEFREEGGFRYRIRWNAGKVLFEIPKEVIWALECEITPELLAEE